MPVTWGQVEPKLLKRYPPQAKAAVFWLDTLGNVTSAYGRSEWAEFLLPEFLRTNKTSLGIIRIEEVLGTLNTLWDAVYNSSDFKARGLENDIGVYERVAANEMRNFIPTMPLQSSAKGGAINLMISHYIGRRSFTPTPVEVQALAAKATNFVRDYSGEMKAQEKKSVADYLPAPMWNGVIDGLNDLAGLGKGILSILPYLPYIGAGVLALVAYSYLAPKRS